MKEKLASEIIDTCLKMESLGLNQGTSGNVSVRFNDGMLITPSGISYDDMRVDDIVYVDRDGIFEKGKVPSSEYGFHLICYAVRPDINSVVHNHAVNSTAVAILNRPIPPVHYMIAAAGSDYIPCVPYATFGTDRLSDYVRGGIMESKAILLQHHGMIACDISLKKALWLAVEIETAAKIYLKLLAVTDSPPVLSKDHMREVMDKFDSYGLKSI